MLSMCTLRSLVLLSAALLLVGCMDLTQTANKKPKLAQPLPSSEEPSPPPAAEPPAPVTPPSEPMPPAPTGPSSEDLAAKFRAGYDHLLHTAKEVDDFAYDRKGRFSAGQARQFLTRCEQDVKTIAAGVPALMPACEYLVQMIGYADPHDASDSVEKRKLAYDSNARAFKVELEKALQDFKSAQK